MSKAKKFVMEKGYYEILETNPSATTVEIQRSFERLCNEHVNIHAEEPDIRRASAEILFTLTKAYDILTDPFQRLSYDERRFNGKQPHNNEVETIFKEGLRASRNNDNDVAIKFFKEAVTLYPHKTIYRVNLAIAYYEKGMRENAKKELGMALKLDPQNEFAKEVVAKVLFNVSDKKNINFLAHKVNRQIAMAVSGFIFLVGGVGYIFPKINAYIKNHQSVSVAELQRQKAIENNNKLPEDLRRAIDRSSSNSSNNGSNQIQNVSKNVSINKLEQNFKPQGQIYDYSTQVAVKKTYYKDQGMVMVEYKDGSVLTYKPQDLIGWKEGSGDSPSVVITKGNEIIPVPKEIPVTLPDGKTLNPQDPSFPASVFPEYGVETKDNENSKQNVSSVQPTTIPSTVTEPQTNNNPVNVEQQSQDNSTKNNVGQNGPMLGKPPGK